MQRRAAAPTSKPALARRKAYTLGSLQLEWMHAEQYAVVRHNVEPQQ